MNEVIYVKCLLHCWDPANTCSYYFYHQAYSVLHSACSLLASGLDNLLYPLPPLEVCFILGWSPASGSLNIFLH